ncbi:MAG TPA: GTPase HflX [Longimicrobiales bacterium]|nr:GTPase HflX [Longimicrobiales bacterium]
MKGRPDGDGVTVSTAAAQERAILVGAYSKHALAREAEDHLAELASLTDTAGAAVAGTLFQRIDSPHPKYYIGEGKVDELKQLVSERDASLVIFDEELSPSQGRNLEDRLGIRIMDRAELILDIFATRARTFEAQMQVELAQLEYMLPRLKRMWTHLSRIRGGIGFRGPGETQLETDRRLIGRRIRDLRRKLAVVAQQRATRRKGRTGEFRAALVGYTNAGKSSILRSLSGTDIFVENRLFATLDPSTRSVELGPGARVLVTDTVGFIRRLPHHLVASFRATLEEAVEADVLLHVIDGSHPNWEEQKFVVEGVLRDLDLEGRRTILVFNKTDRLTHSEEESLRHRVMAGYREPAVFVSAAEPDGLLELRSLLFEEIREMRPAVRLEIQSSDGQSIATVYREGEVLRQVQHDTCTELVARLPEATLGRLRQRGVMVTAEP